MKMYFLKIVILSFLLNSSITPQTFITNPFIVIPGNNYDIDVLNAGSVGINSIENYLCWINQTDTNYSIYVKEISPILSDNVLLYTSKKEIIGPKLSFYPGNNLENLRIVWQMKTNNHWQILTRELINDSLTNVREITDSLSNNVMLQMEMEFRKLQLV